MIGTNGKSDSERAQLDLDHELPAPEHDGSESGAQDPAPVATAALSEEVERLKKERDQLYDRAARQQAEFENYRKRAAREQADFREYAIADTLKSLLPIIDSFDRALRTEGGGGEFRSGIELINRQLHDALTRMGVRTIDPEGQPFDPRLHEAVEMVATNDVEDNHVLQVLQRGYMLKDRLLRPAMVRVARKS
jgi:molecular chaperone GrpE